MRVFRYSFYDKNSLWMHVQRRGVSFELETTRSESPVLYGTVMRAVASTGGGPGSRWRLFQYYDSLHQERRPPQSTYDMEHLRYDLDDSNRQRGCQHREAHRGCSRGIRSEQALERRWDKFVNNRRQGRRDYREWKRECKDATRRVPGGPHPLPPAYPRPTNTIRLQKQLKPCESRSTRHAPHQVRDIASGVSFPLPTGTFVKLATWNVEGLREVSKYDQIFRFAKQRGIELVLAQETKATSSHTFVKNGWEILHSGHPQSKHHGVGFFVSPSLRPHVMDFKPHSPRICEITVNVSPRKITVFNIYAPSQVEDADEDRQRKSYFWTELNSILVDHPNLDFTIIAGDCNARLGSDLDPESDYIGPHVVGERQSIQDEDRDNAIFLYDTLQAHNLTLPQTFSTLPFAKLCTYKELTCDDHLLQGTDVRNWTTLDYVAVPIGLRKAVRFEGSIFQQLINSRHLPVTFSIQTQFDPVAKPPSVPKKDYSNLEHFSAAVESKLLDETSNTVILPHKTEQLYIAYTDGSCPNNRVVSADNPAGWGFAITSAAGTTLHPPPDSTWILGYGPVKTSPLSAEGPLPGSNNTGELKALIELFDYLLYYSQFAAGSSLTIYTDSSYARNLILGSSLPATHPQLVSLAQQYYAALRCMFHVQLLSVPAHEGIPGNEIADRLAKQGVYSRCSIGRFSYVPAASLSPPEVGFNVEEWTSKTIEEQDSKLTSILTDSLPLIPELPLSAKKPWISSSTLSLIDKFQKTRFDDISSLKIARKQIKKSACKDKKQFVSSCLYNDFHGSSVHQWTHARTIRSPFQPRATGLFNLKNKLVSKTQRPSTFADYLANKLWFSEEDPPVPVSAPQPICNGIEAPFTMQNLNAALRKLKRGKASGPNGLACEIYKHAPYVLKSFMLEHYNQCLEQAVVPDSWMLSEVVMIIKNHAKDTRSLSNYRPISLTNISYKIFASMLQTRLEYYLDDRIRDRQFGFRKHRSTSQPIHVLRRLIEIYERQTSSFHALFLDWSKAFDSVTFTSISSAMEFMGVPNHMIAVVMALYRAPTFVVRDFGLKSAPMKQTKGLRQGCPLSPYLFSFILTHLFHTVEERYASQYGEIPGVFYTPKPVWDLEYADDTVLLSNSADQLTRLLHLVQEEGRIRGLALNEEKCEHMSLNTNRRIYYQPSTSTPCPCQFCTGDQPVLEPVPLAQEVKYLGAYVDDTSANNKHLRYRISQAIAASKSLRPLTGHNALPPSWKLRVYRAVIQSILLYAMESATLTQSQLVHLDSIHYKNLRRIFKIKSSYYHKVIDPSNAPCSNEYLHQLAYKSGRALPPSRLYSQNRLKLMGHLLRHSDTLESQVVFTSTHAYRRGYGRNRTGRPRVHWAASCLTEASQRLQHMQSDLPPSNIDLHNAYFRIPNTQEVLSAHGSTSMVHLDTTRLYRTVAPVATDRQQWQLLLNKPAKINSH